jgi:hypothetical protein
MFVSTADLYNVAAYEQRPANWEIPVDPGAAIPAAAGGSSGQERQESALHQATGKSFYKLIFYSNLEWGGAGVCLVVGMDELPCCGSGFIETGSSILCESGY